MDTDREFYALHLPNLIGYVVAVLQSKDDEIEMGSGTLVNAGGRHFIATARHCIDANVRVVRSSDPRQCGGIVNTRELTVLRRGWDDKLDVGYLEIADPECAELSWDQLCNDKIESGMVQIVGYPVVLAEVVKTCQGKPKDISIAAGTFGTTLKDETDDKMTFDYPKIGTKYDEATGKWIPSPFPETPHGFSGGACFGVTKATDKIAHVQYKLLAIQFAWNNCDSVFAVPAKRWCELLAKERLV